MNYRARLTHGNVEITVLALRYTRKCCKCTFMCQMCSDIQITMELLQNVHIQSNLNHHLIALSNLSYKSLTDMTAVTSCQCYDILSCLHVGVQWHMAHKWSIHEFWFLTMFFCLWFWFWPFVNRGGSQWWSWRLVATVHLWGLCWFGHLSDTLHITDNQKWTYIYWSMVCL